MTKVLSNWNEKIQKLIEPRWNKRLEVMGIDKVRELILSSRSNSTVNLPNPIYEVNPDTGIRKEFNPPVEFAIEWLNKKINDRNEKAKSVQENTLRAQKIALTISALAATATIANTLNSFF